MKINGYSSVDLNKNTVGKCGLLIGYEPDTSDWSYYLRTEKMQHSHIPFAQSLLSKVTFNANRAVTPTHTFGIEVNLHHIQSHLNLSYLFKRQDLRSRLGPIWFCCQWKLANSVMKAKVNTELTHAVSITNDLGEYGSYSLGF